MAGFLDLTGLSRFKSKLLEAIANVYVTKTAHSKALNLKVNKADLESEIKRVLGTLDTGIPVGAIMAFHDVPAGWLQCNGAAVSRTTYAALFAKIGTKYGSGNGSTTFNLPNLHHKFIEGTTTSSEVGKSVAAGLPNISGSFTLQKAGDFNGSHEDILEGPVQQPCRMGFRGTPRPLQRLPLKFRVRQFNVCTARLNTSHPLH